MHGPPSQKAEREHDRAAMRSAEPATADIIALCFMAVPDLQHAAVAHALAIQASPHALLLLWGGYVVHPAADRAVAASRLLRAPRTW